MSTVVIVQCLYNMLCCHIFVLRILNQCDLVILIKLYGLLDD